jgi:hypothetical protein
MAILDLISSVHPSSFVTMLPKQLQFSTFSVDVFYHKPIFFLPHDTHNSTMMVDLSGVVEIVVLWVSMPHR